MDGYREGWERDVDGAAISGISMNVEVTATVTVVEVVVMSEDIMK